MEERLSVKINALEILEKQLKNRAKRQQHGIIVLSSATDPYLQVEKTYELTRKILELIHLYRFPVHIITKSELVTRDFDVLEKINRDAILPADLEPVLGHKVFVTFSFSTTDDSIGKIFEPGAPLPSKRLAIVKKTLDAGFHSGINLMPLLPYITDTEEHLHMMFKTFHEQKVHYIFPASITLFGAGSYDSKTLVIKAIEKHYPDLAEKYGKLFSSGVRTPPWYRNAFQKKIDRMLEIYPIKNHIGELPC
jgi:DNA repair photolyase